MSLEWRDVHIGDGAMEAGPFHHSAEARLSDNQIREAKHDTADDVLIETEVYCDMNSSSWLSPDPQMPKTSPGSWVRR